MESVVARLNTDGYFGSGAQGINRQNTERRWTVNEDIVVIACEFPEMTIEAVFTVDGTRYFQLSRGKIDIRRNDIEILKIEVIAFWTPISVLVKRS